MVVYVIAALAVLPFLIPIVGAVRGRVRVRPCCPADPVNDTRMRAAFTEERTDR